MTPYLIVAGDLVQSGGMDIANLALAHYLAEKDHEVHIVAHRVASELASHPRVVFHKVPKPRNSYTLGSVLLHREGRRWAARISSQGGRVLVNGGNCDWGDVNWIHYVHAAYSPMVVGTPWRIARAFIHHRWSLREERRIVRQARVVIVNSERTRHDVIERLGIPANRVHKIYFGCDTVRFRPRTRTERALASSKFNWPAGRPCVAFVGQLSDRRKGFDTVFSAWTQLCADPAWDVDLAVIGTGGELDAWRERACRCNLATRIRFLGFCDDVSRVLAACDALVSPVRYEAFGIAAQEALCCGLPTFISKDAGVAELYPKELEHLLLDDPEDTSELVARLRAWRPNLEHYPQAFGSAFQTIRNHTSHGMASQMLELMESERGR